MYSEDLIFIPRGSGTFPFLFLRIQVEVKKTGINYKEEVALSCYLRTCLFEKWSPVPEALTTRSVLDDLKVAVMMLSGNMFLIHSLPCLFLSRFFREIL